MPVQSGMLDAPLMGQRGPRRSRDSFRVFVFAAAFAALAVSAATQSGPTDADLAASSSSRVVRLGDLSNGGRVTRVPLEVYVARVLAGEAEPKAPDGEYEALAVAVRTFAMANANRHGRQGFDLCDTTHCQVPRAATAATRRAALATAGQVLAYNGMPAEVFYSASCGGRSEAASAVWPSGSFPYLRSVEDDVHEEDEPWVTELTLAEIREALIRNGFSGQRLRDVGILARSESGRVTRLRLSGLRPEEIGGEPFRAAIGASVLRSTAFSVTQHGDTLRFTGRGYGHGIGLCVIGAGRRALRGEDARAILAHYYPGLALVRLDDASPAEPASPLPRDVAPPAPRAAPAPPAVVARVPRASRVAAADVERMALRAHDELSNRLGTTITPIAIELHDTLENFRTATGAPWWVSAVARSHAIWLAPLALLEQREGLEATVRTAVAELLVAEALSGRPAWVRVGAGRYFGRATPIAAPPGNARLQCPSDAELTLAVSVTAQGDADARAEACFARAYGTTRDWRSVR